MRVPNGAIHVDGYLNEEIWLKAPPVADFAQQEPTEGAPPGERMEVRFVFDEANLYVGARMYGARDTIQAPKGRRDDVEQAEYLQVELDTFLDRRTAYMFGVTASGVRQDHFHPSDNETDIDEQFDPVWAARTHIDDAGWTAEMWIPFSQLRFNDQAERIWGLNIRRYRPQLNEQDYWVVIGRTNRGWASRFGNLRGIDELRPTPAARGSALRLVIVAHDRQPESEQSVRCRTQPVRARRRRHEDRPRSEPDARGDGQPGLRAGGTRSGGGEPDGVRDDLR